MESVITVNALTGIGPDYGIVDVDSKQLPLDGSKTYRLRLPPSLPIRDLWTVTIHHAQSPSMLPAGEPLSAPDGDQGRVRSEPGWLL